MPTTEVAVERTLTSPAASWSWYDGGGECMTMSTLKTPDARVRTGTGTTLVWAVPETAGSSVVASDHWVVPLGKRSLSLVRVRTACTG